MSKSVWVKINHIIFLYLVVTSTTWIQGNLQELQNYFFWEFQRNQNCGLSYLSCFSHVPDHCAWKPAHHCGYYLWLPSPHALVLSALQLVLCRHLLHLHHHPEDAAEHLDAEKSHNYASCITQMYFCHTLCRIVWLSLDHDGLWLLHGHLPPQALRSCHEPPAGSALLIIIFYNNF